MAHEEKKNKRELKTIFMVEFTNFNLPFVLPIWGADCRNVNRVEISGRITPKPNQRELR
jgi:hypothetical protein